MLKLTQFNRKFSIRKPDEFKTPRVIPFERLEIPRNSILHTIDMNRDVLCLPVSTPYLQGLERAALVRHHFRLATNGIIGRPIDVPVQGQEREIMEYHRANRFFRRFNNSDAVIKKDEKVLLIENYTPLLPHYRYAETNLMWYHRLYNVMVTMIDQIKKDAATYPSRQNFIILEIGNKLPSFINFRNTYKDRVKNKLERFDTLDLLWLLELFAWAEGDIKNSIFAEWYDDEGKAHEVTLPMLSNINFILKHKGGFTNINLGSAERYRKSSGGLYDDELFARNFYSNLVTIMTKAPVLTSEDYDEDEVNLFAATPEELAKIREEEKLKEDDYVEYNIEDAEVSKPTNFDDDQEIVIEEPVEDVKPTEIVIERKIERGDIIKRELDELSRSSRITPKAYEFLYKSSERFNELPDPYGSGKTIGEASVVTEEEIKVKSKEIAPKGVKGVLDNSWAQSTLPAMTKKYNKEILPKDILAAVASSQRLGLIIHDHKIEKTVSASGNSEHHTLRVQIPGDDPVSVHFTIPSLTEEGTFFANGTEYTMRHQRVDIPIRKINPSTVSLTTAYGKNFVTRSDKVVNDYGRWLTNNVIVRAVDPTNGEFSDAHLTNVFDPSKEVPRYYSMMATRVSQFKSMGYSWNFDINKVEEFFADKNKGYNYDREKLTPVAKGRNTVLVMDKESQLFEVAKDKKTEEIVPVGEMAEFLNLNQAKAPREMTELSIMGKSISVGFILSMYLGFTGMLRAIGATYEIVPPGQRVNNDDYHSVLRLADCKMLIKCDSSEQKMIVSGLDKYLKSMRQYTESEVDREDMYLNLLRDVDKLTPRYFRELKRMRNGFVDDMHARILRYYNEPETFIGLLIRSNELLQTDMSKPEVNGDEMLILGYQRIPFHIYTALSRAMRNYDNAPPSGRKFELTQDMIWGEITQDPSVLLVPGANPVQGVREKTVVTMGGTGGRTGRTLVESTRVYTESDLGITSGNTVDNGDAGAITFLSNDPQFATVDGIPAKRDPKKLRPGEVLSPVDGLVPDTLRDDSKRQVFVSIQFGSMASAKGARSMPYRTGGELTIGAHGYERHYRQVERDCKVVEVADDHITVKYNDDGKEESFPLGRWYGKHEGTSYPHNNVTPWKKGDKLEANDTLLYNENFFEMDIMNPKAAVMKWGAIAWVGLTEEEGVVEDSTEIDEEIAALMKTEVDKAKPVTLAFDQVLNLQVKEGDKVDFDTILCTFHNELGGSSEHSEEVAQTLFGLSSSSPTAGVRGYLDSIEVVYHGELEDMSESVREFVKKYDRRRKAKSKFSRDPMAETGQVGSEWRVDGVPLPYNHLAIYFHIVHELEMEGGSKLVFGNQLKATVISKMIGENYGEKDKRKLNAKFSRVSADDRMVGSIYFIATANACGMQGGVCVGNILDGKDYPKLPDKL